MARDKAPESRRKVAGALMICADKLLLLKRVDGRWALPGGGVDEGEIPPQAVAREVFEETGYKCKESDFRFLESLESRDPLNRFTYYLHQIDIPTLFEPKLDPNEHEDCRWCTVEEALSLKDLFKRLDSIIKKYMQG